MKAFGRNRTQRKTEPVPRVIRSPEPATQEPMFSRSRPREMAAAIRRYVEEGIATQKLRHGDKLPNERELASKFGTGRNTVRKLLIALEEEGKIYRHVGQGTFIKAPLSEAGANGRDSESENVARIASPLDLMELRMIVEPQIAELAAHRAGLAEIERMQFSVESSKSARTLQEFEDWDDTLHRTIAGASRNPLFVTIAEIITSVRKGAEWGTLKKETLSEDHKMRHLLEHLDLVDAIRRRDAGAARREMERHLSSVKSTMFRR